MNVDRLKDDIDELVRSIQDKSISMHNEIFEEPGTQKFKPEINKHKKALKAYDSLLRNVYPQMKDISDRINANSPTYEFSIKVLRAGLKHLRDSEKKIGVTKNNSDEAVYIEQYKAFLDEVISSGETILRSLEALRGGKRTRRNRRSK